MVLSVLLSYRQVRGEVAEVIFSRGWSTPSRRDLSYVGGHLASVRFVYTSGEFCRKWAKLVPTLQILIKSIYLSNRVFSVGDLSQGSHLFPFRTEKLSPVEPMIVLGRK